MPESDDDNTLAGAVLVVGAVVAVVAGVAWFMVSACVLYILS